MFDLSLFGRLSFTHATPGKAALPPGRNALGIADERDAILYVPRDLDLSAPIPLVTLFHGAGGSAERILPILEDHAERERFLLLAPQSQFPTWDIVIGGNGPDLERLNLALATVADHYRLDAGRFAFAGFSDGGSYALSTGLTNGNLVSHIMVFSGGFMSVMMPEGEPRVFIAHGLVDEQLPIATSGRANAGRLQASGYDVEYVEFNGRHVVEPPIVSLAVDFFLQDVASET